MKRLPNNFQRLYDALSDWDRTVIHDCRIDCEDCAIGRACNLAGIVVDILREEKEASEQASVS